MTKPISVVLAVLLLSSCAAVVVYGNDDIESLLAPRDWLADDIVAPQQASSGTKPEAVLSELLHSSAPAPAPATSSEDSMRFRTASTTSATAQTQTEAHVQAQAQTQTQTQVQVQAEAQSQSQTQSQSKVELSKSEQQALDTVAAAMNAQASTTASSTAQVEQQQQQQQQQQQLTSESKVDAAVAAHLDTSAAAAMSNKLAEESWRKPFNHEAQTEAKLKRVEEENIKQQSEQVNKRFTSQEESAKAPRFREMMQVDSTSTSASTADATDTISQAETISQTVTDSATSEQLPVPIVSAPAAPTPTPTPTPSPPVNLDVVAAAFKDDASDLQQQFLNQRPRSGPSRKNPYWESSPPSPPASSSQNLPLNYGSGGLTPPAPAASAPPAPGSIIPPPPVSMAPAVGAGQWPPMVGPSTNSVPFRADLTPKIPPPGSRTADGLVIPHTDRSLSHLAMGGVQQGNVPLVPPGSLTSVRPGEMFDVNGKRMFRPLLGVQSNGIHPFGETPPVITSERPALVVGDNTAAPVLSGCVSSDCQSPTIVTHVPTAVITASPLYAPAIQECGCAVCPCVATATAVIQSVTTSCGCSVCPCPRAMVIPNVDLSSVSTPSRSSLAFPTSAVGPKVTVVPDVDCSKDSDDDSCSSSSSKSSKKSSSKNKKNPKVGADGKVKPEIASKEDLNKEDETSQPGPKVEAGVKGRDASKKQSNKKKQDKSQSKDDIEDDNITLGDEDKEKKKKSPKAALKKAAKAKKDEDEAVEEASNDPDNEDDPFSEDISRMQQERARLVKQIQDTRAQLKKMQSGLDADDTLDPNEMSSELEDEIKALANAEADASADVKSKGKVKSKSEAHSNAKAVSAAKKDAAKHAAEKADALGKKMAHIVKDGSTTWALPEAPPDYPDLVKKLEEADEERLTAKDTEAKKAAILKEELVALKLKKKAESNIAKEIAADGVVAESDLKESKKAKKLVDDLEKAKKAPDDPALEKKIGRDVTQAESIAAVAAKDEKNKEKDDVKKEEKKELKDAKKKDGSQQQQEEEKAEEAVDSKVYPGVKHLAEVANAACLEQCTTAAMECNHQCKGAGKDCGKKCDTEQSSCKGKCSASKEKASNDSSTIENEDDEQDMIHKFMKEQVALNQDVAKQLQALRADLDSLANNNNDDDDGDKNNQKSAGNLGSHLNILPRPAPFRQPPHVTPPTRPELPPVPDLAVLPSSSSSSSPVGQLGVLGLPSNIAGLHALSGGKFAHQPMKLVSVSVHQQPLPLVRAPSFENMRFQVHPYAEAALREKTARTKELDDEVEKLLRDTEPLVNHHQEASLNDLL